VAWLFPSHATPVRHKRTNMQRDGTAKSDVSITYDKDVANRTNMQRDVPPALGR